MGGLVSAAALWRRAQAGLPLPQALILSSPALDVGMGVATRALLALLNRWAPNLTVGNGLSLDQLCHDPAVTQAYVADPLVHSRISARLAAFFQHWGPCVLSRAKQWPLATLVLYAQADALVRASGSASFVDAAKQGGAPVEAQGFEGLFHEIFNEPEAMAAPLWCRLQEWLQTAPGQNGLSP
jgi:alpha-beta hydrolase superfamily lysophospholipase